MDAPERIWVQPDIKGYCITGVWPWQPSEQRNVREYIRADRHEAIALAAEELALVVQTLLDVMPRHKMELPVRAALAAFRAAQEGEL